MSKTIFLALLAAAVSLAACGSAGPDPRTASIDAGTGSGADVRKYELPAADVWKAVEGAVACERLQIERRTDAEGGGEIVARRADGHRVKVTMRAVGGEGAEVSVCVEPGNPELAGMIQGRVGQKLNLTQARANLFGERSVETSYELELDQCVAAAVRACRALDLEVTHQQVRDSRAQIEARDSADRPVRFTMRLTDGRVDETEVILATEPAIGGEKEFLRKVRQELERHLFPTGD